MGYFVTFEGGEGTGKSTQVRLLAKHLERLGEPVILTREPGGSPRGEAIRKLLLEGKIAKFGPFAEALLFSIARDDHLETIIRPALGKGHWVLCDRFMDSTMAYQGAGGHLSPSVIKGLEHTVVGNTRPDLTILIDLSPTIGLKRARTRLQLAGGGNTDRFESMDMKFHERLRESFLEIARAEPDRFLIFDGDVPPDELAQQIWSSVKKRFSLAQETASKV